AAEDNMITNRHVPTENRVIGKDDVISYLAVVPDMGAHHNEAHVPNSSDTAILFGARAHGYVFTDVTFGAHNQTCRSSPVAEQHRRRSERRDRQNNRTC